MARRSPTVVNQTCNTGCTWRMFGIFNFREGNFCRRLLSNTDANDAGDGSSRHSSDVLSRVDEKYPHVGVSSRRRRHYGCKSISCVENVHVATDQGSKAPKMTIDRKFVDTNYQGNEGVVCQPEQLMDALQILYSNKELFLNLLQDPNSLLVKQIHDLQSSLAKDSYQKMEKRHNARQCGKLFKSFDRYDSNSSCEPQLSNKIVILKPCTDNVKNFIDARFDSPWPNAQNVKPSHFPLGRMKRKLRYAMRVRRKEQQWRKVSEIAERDLPVNGSTSIEERLNSSLDLKGSELCMGNEVPSFGESFSRITNNGSISPSEETTFNLHVEGRKSQSDMRKRGIEEFKAKSFRRLEPLPVFESSSTLQRYYNRSSDDEGLRYRDDYQKDHRTKLGLQKEVVNGSYSCLSYEIKDAQRSNVNMSCEKLQPFGIDISFRESLSGGNVHLDYDALRDGGYKNSPTQNFDKSNSAGGIESFQDLHPEIQSLSFSPEVASSSLSSCERTEDTINTVNRSEHPIAENGAGSFTGENDINPPVATFQPDELPVKPVQEKFEENSLREIMKVFTLKWDELVTKCELSNDLQNPSTFDELKESIGQISWDAIFLDCIIQTFLDVYKNCCFPLHIARKSPNFQAHVAQKVLVDEITELINLHFLPHPSQLTLEHIVGKDLSRNGSWLNIQADTKDIVIQVEEHVLENLVLEIVSEMDIKA